ncbi:MAG: S8 family serine peptidase [Methylobacterium frigidaeris]
MGPDIDTGTTIGSIAGGHLSIAVGSYDAHKSDRPISWFSSAGPTRNGRDKPEISAPGEGVMAAHSRTGRGVVAKSGTSMAAPAAAGIIALLLDEAQARGLSLSVHDIRNVVLASARRDPPGGTGWHARFGHGRISAHRIIEDFLTTHAPPSAPPTA